LAREASAHNVDGCEVTRSCLTNVCHAAVRVRPVSSENRTGPGLALDLPDDLTPERQLKPKLQATDAREQ